jgi:hypothetical protein
MKKSKFTLSKIIAIATLVLCFLTSYPLLIDKIDNYSTLAFFAYYRAFLWLFWSLIILFFGIIVFAYNDLRKKYLKLYLFNLLVIVLIVGAVSIKVQVENNQYNETLRRTKSLPKETIYGTWVDTENNGVKITIDSLRKELIIDYSKSGGKVFKSNFQLNNKNQITSDILPLGAELIIDENLHLNIYPLATELKEDIELIYAVQFKQLK